MADIGGHGSYVPRFHQYLRPGPPRLHIFDFPKDLIGGLNKPFHAIITVEDRQDVFFRGGAQLAILDGGANRWIPGNVGT